MVLGGFFCALETRVDDKPIDVSWGQNFALAGMVHVLQTYNHLAVMNLFVALVKEEISQARADGSVRLFRTNTAFTRVSSFKPGAGVYASFVQDKLSLLCHGQAFMAYLVRACEPLLFQTVYPLVNRVLQDNLTAVQ